MQLGIGSYSCAWAVGVPGYVPSTPISAVDLLHMAKELGVSLVQIADNLPLDVLSTSGLEEVRAISETLGIVLEIGTRGIGDAHLRRYVEISQFLGSKILRVVVDTADHQPIPEDVIATLDRILPALERADIVLAVENHDRFSAATFARIVQALDSRHIGICLDTVNSFGALEGPEVVVETLGPLTVNLHVKDFAISRLDHMMGFVIEGRPAGKGRLDVPWLFDRLGDHGRSPNAILELWTPFQGTIQETIQLERLWLSESVDYLKDLCS